MKTTYTVPEVPGAQRKSERPYTHAVVGRRNLVKVRASIVQGAEYAAGEQRFDHHTRQLETGAGNSYLYRAAGCRPFMVKVSEEDFAKASAFLAENPSRAAYVAKYTAEQLAKVGAGDEGPLVVLQWSMSQKNAAAKVGQWREWYSSVRVVECVPAAPKAKKEKDPA